MSYLFSRSPSPLSPLPEDTDVYSTKSSQDSDGSETDHGQVSDQDEGRLDSPHESPHTPPQDDTELLPPSSLGWVSSPVKGTKEEQIEIRRRKRERKDAETKERNKKEKEEREGIARQIALHEVLDTLHSKNLKLWDILEFVFNPANQQGNIRYNEFFANPGCASQVLEWWLSPKNRGRRAKEAIKRWIADYAARTVSREARRITKSKEFQTANIVLNAETVRNFDLENINKFLSQEAPFAMRILEAFSTSRHASKHTENRRRKTNTVITSTALSCLGEYSHANNLFKRMLSLYLYASGAQRQSITVLSTLGICESYTNLMSKNIKRRRKAKASAQNPSPPPQTSDDNPFLDVPLIQKRTGTVYQLSDSMRARAQELAATGLYVEDYDNININYRSGEQIVGHHDTQENGTSVTIAPLFDTKIEDLDLKAFQDAYLNAPPLKLQDIVLLGPDQKQFKMNLIHCILRIIIKHRGPGFQKFKERLGEEQLVTPDKIPVHKTELYPLPTWPIDESTITGNAEVDEAVRKELKLGESPTFLRPVCGDQLTVARLQALELIRSGQEAGHEGYFWGAWMTGLFHTKIADAHGTLLNHLGKPDSGAQNPGSLAFHNARLDRLPITATSLPTFRTCRDLIFVSLYARVLHCLLLVSGHDTLDECAASINDWQTLAGHATKLFDEYANVSRVEKLRSERAKEMETAKEGAKPMTGDAVFENACLFLRDALVTREFNDAIKCGDSGRIVLVLKTWALSFRGNGRTKYAHEMLHLIHNLTSAWPPAVRNMVLKNWLVNPSGLPDRFVEMDLTQEHLNYKIKVAYKARGSNASWEWLETISPCVVALSDLQKAFNDTLGGEQGLTHAEVDLRADIQSLIDCLKEYQIYIVHLGRILSNDEIAKEVTGLGLHNLTAGEPSPLSDFNDNLTKLQKRRGMKPVTSDDSDAEYEERHTSEVSQPNENSNTTAIPPTQGSESSQLEPPLEVDTNAVNSDQDLEPAEEDEGEVEGPTELQKILAEVEGNDEPTLQRLSEEDVAYDMDEVEVEVEVDDDDSESSSDDDGDESEESESELE